jgi:transposase
MEKRDSRKVSSDVLEEKRRQAVALSKRGLKRSAIGEIVGAHADTVGRWLKRYAERGAAFYKSLPRGRRLGECRRLSAAQEAQIRKLLIDKIPEQLKLDFALWTRQAVRELIELRCGFKMPIRSVGEYLKRWGFTPQKPLRRAYEQKPEAVQRWLATEYPVIRDQAKSEGGEIYWGDETGLRTDCQHGRGYALKGRTPVISLNVRRESINMISAISNQGLVRFRLFEGSFKAALLIDFMKRLIKGSGGRKVFLILDNLKAHHAKVVKAWLSEPERDKEMEVFYLPSYSPELNPDEYLNCDLKCGVHSGTPARNKEQLSKKAIGHMRMLQKKPNRVRKYFHHPKIRYAA